MYARRGDGPAGGHPRQGPHPDHLLGGGEGLPGPGLPAHSPKRGKFPGGMADRPGPHRPSGPGGVLSRRHGGDIGPAITEETAAVTAAGGS